MSLTEYLTQLNTVKSDIRNAIEEKGVDMNQVPFTQYANKIRDNWSSNKTNIDELPVSYPGYMVKYGTLQTYEVSTTKADADRVITFPDGIIPLALSIDLKFGTTNSESHRRFTIDGLFYANHGGLNGIANSDFVQSDIDLESYYGSIDAIPSSLSYYGWSTETNREVKGTITITKWLEPIENFTGNRIYLFKDGVWSSDIEFTLSSVADGNSILRFATSGSLIISGIDVSKYTKMIVEYKPLTFTSSNTGSAFSVSGNTDDTVITKSIANCSTSSWSAEYNYDNYIGLKMTSGINKLVMTTGSDLTLQVSKIWLETDSETVGTVKIESSIPAGIDAIYNTSWEALAGAGNSPYTSEVFDSGNNNKKGVYLCIRNAFEAIAYGSNDQSDWQPVISGNTGGSNDGETGTPKNLVSEEVDYRYFKATCTGYNNGHPTTVSWGIFEVNGSVEGGNTGTNTTKTQQLSQTTNTLNGGETQTLTFTFSDLNQVLGITDISGCIEYVWLQSMAINGNVVTVVVGNKRSAGDGKSTTIKLTAVGI